MAAPVIQTGDTKTGNAASSTSWTIDYPTNIAAGDLLFLVASANGSTSGMSAPAGWSPNGSNLSAQGGYFKKKATGSESGTFTLTLGVARAGTWIIYRITGWGGSIGSLVGWGSGLNVLDGDVGTPGGASGTSTTPESQALNPRAWDTEDTLYLSFFICITSETVSGFPSGYTDTYSSNTNSTLGIASKAVSGAASDDPGPFTIGASVAWQAFTVGIRSLFGPTIHHGDVKSGTVTSNSTSWALTYPTNLASGDLIVAFIGRDGGSGAGTWPSGWVTNQQPVGTAATLIIAKKLSDGTETGNFNVTALPSEQGGWMVQRITNWEGTLGTDFGTSASAGSCLIASGGNATGTTATPDIPSGDPANWVAEDTLWIAACAVDTSRTFTAWPTSYSPGTSEWDVISGGAGGASLSFEYRRVNASSENPGSWTIDTSDDWSALLIAVRPAAVVVQSLVLQQGFVNFGATAVLMGGIRRAWHRRRSGIFVPDHEWVTA